MQASRRYHSLDGLRGVAALVVILYHALLIVPAISTIYVGGRNPSIGSLEWWLYRTPLRLPFAGHEAVLIFFVLSGFVLTLPLTRLAGKSWDWFAYYARRLFRLYLPVWGALIFALILALLVVRQPDFGSTWLQSHKPPTASAVGKDAYLLSGVSNLDSPLWSLRWEVWFSILLPVMFGALLLFKVRRWWKTAALVLILVSAVAKFPSVAHALPVSWMTAGMAEYLPIFGLGMVLVFGREHLGVYGAAVAQSRNRRRHWALIIIAALALTVSPSLVGRASTSYGPLDAAAYAASLVGIALIFFITLECGRVARTLDRTPFQWLGSRSFSIYLIHEPILVAVALLTKANGYLPWLLIFAVLLPIILLVAEGFYRVVERPAHLFSRKIGAIAEQRPRLRTGQVQSSPIAVNTAAAVSDPPAQS